MSEAEIEVQGAGETFTVNPETGEIRDESPGEPLEEETEDEPAENDEQTEEAPAEEPQASGPKSDKEMEQVFKSLERLRKDTAKRVGNIFGDDALQLMECPLCAAVAPGYLWPQDIAPLHEEQVTALRLMLNMPVPTDYKTSDAYEKCPVCAGKGQVRTGSEVQNREIIMCPRCKNYGYITTAVGPVSVPDNGREQDASLATGPTVYGLETQARDEPEDPAIQALKDRGYMVIEPLPAPRPSV